MRFPHLPDLPIRDKLIPSLKKILSNDVTKLVLFLIATFTLAAVLVPHVYNIGKFLAEITATKSINPTIDYIGSQANKADYADFFNRSLYLAAILLLPFLLFSLHAQKAIATTRGPWSFALPARSIAPNRGQALIKPSHPFIQLLGGFITGTVFLFVAGALAILLGFFTCQLPQTSEVIMKAFTTASIVAIVEEVIFHGIILGVFLRTFRPSLAISLVALCFATLHFMRPPQGVGLDHPESTFAGFTFLKITASRLLDSHLMLQQWTPLFFVGILLGITRFLTSSLWLPTGLHIGWLFAFLLFDELTVAQIHSQPWTRLIIGDNLAQGFLPLAAIGVCALVIWVAYRKPDEDDLTPHPQNPFNPSPL